MSFWNKLLVGLLFLLAINTKAQDKLVLTSPLIFKHSNFELKLFNNQQFKYKSVFYSCIVELDKNGKEINNADYSFAEGTYQVKDNKLLLTVKSSSGYYFLEKEYYFLILDKKTFLISNKDRKNLKETRMRRSNKSFPNYIIDTDNSREYTFYKTDQKVTIERYEKDKIYQLFK
ncbi:hypothetical protein [Empedobacter brevis]|uniref:Uncharacterized protein n=1 Tax=Empedobacter brevis NBRC 14943 = ATCC 43319 TaxID=1218108 RepID=A0A511NF67_9FLAO|nr:hypothetical protein [Empedobacter brevis]GEM50941.1 hypothetical protein EB1_07310 [Empedobacter brevis NBRC 14943 = ATCC 43319]